MSFLLPKLASTNALIKHIEISDLTALRYILQKCITIQVPSSFFFLPEFMLTNKDLFLSTVAWGTIMKGSITFLQEPVMFSTGSFFLLFSERNGEVKRI